MSEVRASEGDYDDGNDDNEESSMELAKQRKLLKAVAQQARQYQGLDFDEIEDHDEIMRQIYRENLLFKQSENNLDVDGEPTAD